MTLPPARTLQLGPRLLTALALALTIAGLYLLLHPYEGIVHDSRLYALQALNHLNPELYGNDVFLKYGSQDSYTLFTPLYAGLVALLGVEGAASLLTLISAVALVLCALWFSRSLMPPAYTWLGVGLLVLIPGHYGFGLVFAVAEGFGTPRMLAESLVLCALTASLRKQHVLSTGLFLVGAVIHPLMAFPGVMLLVLMNWQGRCLRKWQAFLLAAVLVLACIVATQLPLSGWQFDDTWWKSVESSPHLVLGLWTPHDWARVSTIFVTLWFAALSLEGVARKVAAGALIVCILSLLLAWIGGDLLKVVLVVQGQAWRSLWLGTTVAALLLPWVAVSSWRKSTLGRCGVLLLVAAWVLGSADLALYFAAASMVAIAFSRMRVSERIERIAFALSVVVTGVALLCVLSLTGSDYSVPDPAAPAAPWLDQLRKVSDNRLLPVSALMGVWYATTKFRTKVSTCSLALSVALLVAPVAAETGQAWVNRTYPRTAWLAFAEWRALIPEGSDVLWATKLVDGGDPTAAWLLLERPSYFSSVQYNSALFSRRAATELHNRIAAIPVALPTEQPVAITFRGRLAEAPSCAKVPTQYVVTDVPLSDAVLIRAPTSAPPPFNRLQLRICRTNHHAYRHHPENG